MKLPLIVLLALPSFAQAVVESSVLSGAAAAAATGAKGAGKSAGAVFGRVGQIAGKAPQPAAATPAANTAAPAPAASAAKPASAPKPVDPASVKVGLTRKDLLARCGEPTMSVLGNRRSASAETFWYATTDNDELKVELEAGVVTRVTSLRAERLSRKR